MPKATPKVITFSVAVVIALIAAIIHYAHLAVPYVHTGFTLSRRNFAMLRHPLEAEGLIACSNTGPCHQTLTRCEVDSYQAAPCLFPPKRIEHGVAGH